VDLQPVLDVEEDLTAQFAARSAPSGADRQREPELLLSTLARLDRGQAAAAASLAGARPLLVIEGAAPRARPPCWPPSETCSPPKAAG
jgi:hypothetical protein